MPSASDVIASIGELFEERRAAGAQPMVGAMLHSLAFGATLHYVTDDEGRKELSRKQMEMTADVMAHSLVYWTRDLYHAGLLQRGSRLYAMSSEGAILAVPTYGAVSAAKAALEAHVRQLALELAPEPASPSTPSVPASPTHPPCAASPAGRTWCRLRGSAIPSGRLTTPGRRR